MNSELYDEINRTLTEYEEIVDRPEDDYLTDDLVDIGNKMFNLLCQVIERG